MNSNAHPVAPTGATPLKAVQAAAKAALGLALAVFTMNLVAWRMYNLPSAPDPVFGEAHEPGRPFRQQIEGDGSGVWASNCVRRAALPALRQGPRLLILGDSYTEAVQVRDEEHFAHRLEQRLAGPPVLALGRSGYSVADYVAQAATFRRLFTPTWVIIPVGAGDFEADAWAKKEGGYARFEWVKQPRPAQSAGARHGPRASLPGSGSLQIVSLPLTQPGWLSTMVRDRFPFWFPLVTFAYLRQSELTDWMADQRQPWFHASPAKAGEEGPASEPMDSYPLDAEMGLLAEAYPEQLTLLFLPRFDPQNPGEETETEKVLRGLALKHGVRFVSLGRKFPELAAEGRAPYGFGNTRFNWGHWNRYGHQAAADLLFAECQKLGIGQ